MGKRGTRYYEMRLFGSDESPLLKTKRKRQKKNDRLV